MKNIEYKIYILRTKDDLTPRYVGITSGKLSSRLVKHIHDIKRKSCKNLHKKNWLLKYKNSVIIEQLDAANSISEMKEKEKFYISKFRNEGISLLNATNGGDGSYGYKHNDETIKKISGENNHMYGKTNLINKELFGKKVECSIDNGANWISYSSIREAAKLSKISFKSIKLMCEGRYIKPKHNLLFRYFGEELKLGKTRKINDQSIRKKPVECLINNNWVKFLSATDAAKELKLNRSKIIFVCNGYRKSTGGLFFRYFGSQLIPINKDKSGRKGNKISIEYKSDINIYDSIMEASIKSGIPRKSIAKIIKGEFVRKYMDYKINIII